MRNPRRTAASVVGVALAVGLLSSIAFFVDSSASRMTQHAVAPVTIDMQAEVANTLASSLRISETMSPKPPLAFGQRVDVSMTVTNTATTPSTFTILDVKRPASFAYVAGSTRRDGVVLPDRPSSDPAAPPTPPTEGGLLLGTLPAHASTTVTYQAIAAAPVSVLTKLDQAEVRSIENPQPTSPGAPTAIDLDRVLQGIRRIPGVKHAQPFALLDLPAGALRAGAQVLPAPVKLIAFDPSYLRDFPVIRITSGNVAPGGAVVSLPVAQALGSAPGAPLTLQLPGRPLPVATSVSGVADLSGAQALFANRNPDNQGEYVAAPYVVGVDMSTFRSVVLPALRLDAASPAPQAKPPTLEFQVGVDRGTLATDPNQAFVTTGALGHAIERVSPGNLTTINNLSDILRQARTDATLAKVLFVVLGLPGIALAGYLSFYAGGLLSEAQRRERALLRARGFGGRALQRVLALHAALIAALASLAGLGLGVATATWAFPSDFAPSTHGYVVSALIAVVAAALTTTLAMYLPARRSLTHEVREERRQLDTRSRPLWARIRLDLWLLLVAVVVGGVFLASGGLKAGPSAETQSVSQSFYVLIAPLAFWVGATLLAARIALLVSRKLARRSLGSDPATDAGKFGDGLVRKTVVRSVVRRPAAAVAGAVALSLAVAFGVSLTMFVDSYRSEQRNDARFAVGSDIRVTTGSSQVLPADFASQLRVHGVRAVSAVFQDSNATVGATKVGFVAVDPSSFPRVAPLRDAYFTDISAGQAMRALATDPAAVLVADTAASSLGLRRGDPVAVQFASRAPSASAAGGASGPLTAQLHVVGTYHHFPGYPNGIELVGSLLPYQQLVGAANPDFYLVRTDGSTSTDRSVAAALSAKFATTTPVKIDTTARITNVSQSSLAALNIDALGRIEILYTLAMVVLGVAIFVLGLLFHRRGEYITLRAIGLRMRDLRGLVLGETGIVAIACLVLGAVVGGAMAWMFVQILRQVFIIPPSGLSLPVGNLLVLGALLLGALVLTSLVASAVLRRLRLVEVLRED